MWARRVQVVRPSEHIYKNQIKETNKKQQINLYFETLLALWKIETARQLCNKIETVRPIKSFDQKFAGPMVFERSFITPTVTERRNWNANDLL